MEIVLILLLSFSLLLLLVSFFQKNPYSELKEEVDQLTLQYAQEMYQVKKKLKILEEELLVSGDEFLPKNTQKIHDIIKSQVIALAQQGKPIEQIASQSSLSSDEVFSILYEYNNQAD